MKKLLMAFVVVAIVVFSRTVLSATYYYYEGIVNNSTSYTQAGYYMGCVSSTNESPNYAKVYYEQSSTTTRSSSLSGSVRFATNVKNDALALINAVFAVDYCNSTTWESGTRKGGEYTQSPYTYAELKAYLWKATDVGQEKVRVEYYDDGSGPPPRAESADGDVSLQGEPAIWYEYNDFTASYPSMSEFHLHYYEQSL
jgi:hypothetical protein